jgi:ABC-type Fe3+-citrate transport system substrate-binding protein
MNLRSPSRASQLGLALGLPLVLVLVLVAACSTPEAGADKAKSAVNNDKRDTTIVHEPCDIGSSDAVKRSAGPST